MVTSIRMHLIVLNISVGGHSAGVSTWDELEECFRTKLYLEFAESIYGFNF